MTKLQAPMAAVFEPLLGPARYKGAKGGRGSGKSHFFAEEAVFALLQGKDVLCIREIQNSIADSVKRLIEAKIEAFGLSAAFDITEKEIRCKTSGAVAIFRGMQNHTAASVKSLEGFDIAWWEEAQTASQRSLDLLIPTIRAEGSELWFSWNPQDEDDPIEALLVKNPPESAIVVTANWSDNPWFPAELKEDMERDRKRDPDKYEHVWNGEYRTQSQARVFRHFKEADIDSEIPDNIVWFYGLDWGFSQDPLAGVRFCIPDPKTLYVRNEVYKVGVQNEAIPPFLAQLPDAAKWPMRADSARPELIDYVRRHGFPKLRAAKKGKGSVEDGTAFLQSMDIVVHPSCPNTFRELQKHSFKVDPRTGEVLPAIEDAWNHIIDALRYGSEGLHRKGKMIKETERTQAAPRGIDYGAFDEDEGEENWKVI